MFLAYKGTTQAGRTRVVLPASRACIAHARAARCALLVSARCALLCRAVLALDQSAGCALHLFALRAHRNTLRAGSRVAVAAGDGAVSAERRVAGCAALLAQDAVHVRAARARLGVRALDEERAGGTVHSRRGTLVDAPRELDRFARLCVDVRHEQHVHVVLLALFDQRVQRLPGFELFSKTYQTGP